MGEIERGSLQFIIEPVSSEAQYAQVQSVRNKVFEEELGIKLPRLAFGPGCKIRHMICLTKAGRETVGAVTVQDTTDERALHGRYGLHFPSGKKVARFTQLALLKPYRGLNLNLELVLEAKSSITAPGHFHYTWFVTPARDNTVSFWRRLGYTASPEFVDADMGPSWAMVKNE